jgi:hypothetical protein
MNTQVILYFHDSNIFAMIVVEKGTQSKVAIAI